MLNYIKKSKLFKRFSDIDLFSMSMSGANFWDNARFIMIDVPLNRDMARKILPWGLWLTDPPMATLFIVNYTKTAFTVPYKEAALLIHVRTLFGKGRHCCWMILDDDTALIYGRELLGFPKKIGDFTFNEKGDHISASVTRRGVKLISIEAERAQVQSPPPPVLNHKFFNVGGLGQFFLYNPIWFFIPKETIHESYSAKVSLSLAESQYDPIAKLVSG
ncbi:MAG: acetoacetate decarboxylase family protein, partial [candidate division Zixibacteria bacterium]|nr:acetoacetate decarboxylase family protein [candidate division Zixibacteria bacterium]